MTPIFSGSFGSQGSPRKNSQKPRVETTGHNPYIAPIRFLCLGGGGGGGGAGFFIADAVFEWHRRCSWYLPIALLADN